MEWPLGRGPQTLPLSNWDDPPTTKNQNNPKDTAAYTCLGTVTFGPPKRKK